jgi:hypothetical protein
MKKKILVIPVMLLTFAFLSLPVMAAPATKIEGVVLEFLHTATPTNYRFVDSTIIQSRGNSLGLARLIIPDMPDLLGGTWDTNWASTVKQPLYPDPDPDGWNIIREDVTISFTGGTFEGRAQYKWVGSTLDLTTTPPTLPSVIAVHMVLRGTGDFHGWTVKLSSENVMQYPIDGTLIKPK